MNSGAPNEDDTSVNVTDSYMPDNNVFEDNAILIKEENDFELDSEQDDPTGKILAHVKWQLFTYIYSFNYLN